jgi:hypothetical protein
MRERGLAVSFVTVGENMQGALRRHGLSGVLSG